MISDGVCQLLIKRKYDCIYESCTIFFKIIIHKALEKIKFQKEENYK